MPAPLVSIVIPVYNGANFLREAIDSALAQSWPHCEVLVVNDGSTDGGATEAAALSYGERIRYFHKANGGVASALNLGIREMRGMFFSWLSHDDAYLPDKCRAQVEFWRQCGDPRTVLYADAAVIDAAGEPRGLCPMPDMAADEALYHIWGHSFLNGCTMLIPRALLLEAGGFNEALPTTQDYDLWLRLAGMAHFRRYPDVVLLSRRHEAQGSRSRAHAKECAALFSAHVPHMLRQARERDDGFAGVAPLVARGLARRMGDYGFAGAVRLCGALMEHLRADERRRLVPLLLRQAPYACLRWLWLQTPLCLRGRATAIRERRSLTVFRAALRDGGWGLALGKTFRHLRRVGGRALRVLRAAPACPRRVPHERERPLHVLLDHDAGGGAHAFRERYAATVLTQGSDALVWQYLRGTGRYFFEWRSPHERASFRAAKLADAEAFVRAATPAVVFFNSVAGWPRLPETLAVLLRLRQAGAALHVFLHDFFVLCPAYPLLNRQGVFCGLPAPPAPCGLCLPGHPLAAEHDGMDVAAWRRMWGAFLPHADSLCVADASGKDLIARVYPHLAERIRIDPPEARQVWPPLPIPPDACVVGVIGHIARHKGAAIVEDLIRLMTAQDLDARIVVIGTLESALRHPRLHVTGPYRHALLPSLLRTHGVSMGLVPSPLPETFCYVAQEIEMLGLPLICLDLGAQGARAHRYAKGFPAPTPDAAGCLAAIMRARGSVSRLP